MATYKEIKGVTIQTLDEDPVVGGVAGATWASGNAIPASGYYWGSAGTQTSNIIAGGYGPSGIIATSFQYDGTDWTSAPNINDGREMVTGWGASNTAALIVAGDSPGFTGATEQWDGSSWTEKNDLNTTRIQGGGAGTSYTSGIFFGGRTPPATAKVETEEWDGTSWTEVGDLNAAIRASAGFGITTAAISAGGSTTVSGVESWNGSAWTELSGTLNTGRNSMGVSGTQTSGLVFGGSPPVTTKTEAWNGTTFTEVNDMANSLYARGGSPAGTQTAALASGGQPSSPSPTNFTEEFSAAPVTAAILTEGSIFLSKGTTLKGFGKAAGVPAGTWASGGALNTARGQAGGAGVSQDSAMVSSGRNLGPTTAGTTACEQYNGSSWTEVAENNTARSALEGGGTQTANFMAGGRGAPNTGLGNTEIWNGSGWTEVSDLNTARAYVAGNGTSTAGMIAAGGPPTTAKVETWDGSSWTEVGDLNTAKIYRSLFGGSATTTASVCVGGENPQVGNSETWNGSSWTEGNDLNTARGSSGVAGVSTFGLVFGGQYDSGYYAQTEVYNGTSYTELADLSAANGYTVPANNSPNVSALAAGGFTPSVGTATEEWTAGLALADITVS